jgi:hypothetical protein
MDIPLTIICVDCGADAHLMTLPPEDGWEIGDIVAYRCAGCQDRWDLVVADPDVVRNEADTFDFRQWLADRQTGDQR